MQNIYQKLQKALELQQNGHLQEAQSIYIDILRNNPNCADAWNLYGLLALGVGEHDKSIEFIENATKIEPKIASYRINLSEALKRSHKLQKALEEIETALQIEPDNIDALYNKASVLKNLGRKESAKEWYEKVLALQPNDADALYNLANIHLDNKEYDEAIALYQKALTLSGKNVNILNNLATAYYELGELREADAYYTKALEISPNDPHLHFNLGNTRRAQKNYEYAKKSFQRAISLKAEEPDYTLNLAFLHLLLGEFREGFRLYEIRHLKKDVLLPSVPKKITSRTIPQGAKVFVYHEQGFGDTILFSRFLPLIQNEYFFFPQKELFPFFRECGVHATDIIPSEEDYDISIPLCSLPYLLGIDSKDAVPSPLCEQVDNSKQIEKIGIFYQGNKKFLNAEKKAIPLDALLESIGDIGCELYSLQVEDDEAEGNLGVKNICLQAQDFGDTLKCLEKIDIVVTIDSAMAHLCGSIGKRTILMLHFDCDWRWGLESEKTYWYESLKLIRQEKPNDWSSALKELREYLVILKNI